MKSISSYLKVHILLLSFYKRPTVVFVPANQKNSKEDFHFY